MKVAEIASGHIPSRWAHSINVVSHASAFAKAGHQVELFSVERFYEARLRRQTSLAEWYGVHDIPVTYVRENGWKYYFETPLVQRAFGFFNRVTDHRYFPVSRTARKIARIVSERGIQFCHCRSNDVVPPLLKLGIPLVWETHNPTVRTQVPIIRQILNEAHNPNFRALFTQNKMVRDAYLALDFPQEKIVVHPNAIDLELYQPEQLDSQIKSIRQEMDTGREEFVVAYTGHLYPGRGIDDLLEAAKRCAGFKFWVVGGNPEDVDRHKHHARQLGLKNVVFTGFVSKGRIPAITRAADVLIMPYTRETPTWREMSPIKMYEYLAAGRPVIATDLPNISEVIETGVHGLLVPEKSPAEIAHGIGKLAADAALCRQMGAASAKLAQKYSFRTRVEHILSFAG